MLGLESETTGMHWRELSGTEGPGICDLSSGEHEGRAPFSENPGIASRSLTWMNNKMAFLGEC